MKRTQNFVNNKPTLYLIATPIGNLSEFTPRAIEILKEADYVGCEDTRNSKILFDHFGISTTLISCHEHNENEASEQLISYLLNGKNVCYVSDAGYPGISDPGSRLVKKALDNDINVSVVNGSSAFLTALVASGLETDHFYFHGFLASKESQRENELKEMINRKETLIFYESPHRIFKTLSDILDICGDRKIALVRELTKKFEEVIRGNISEVLEIVSELKGEMVIILDGNKEEKTYDHMTIIEHVNLYIKEGLKTNDAIKRVANDRNIPKQDVYKQYHCQ